MSSPDSRASLPAALRGVRGSVVGLSAASLGIGGHALAGGALPATPVLMAAFGGCVGMGISLSGRRWRLPSLLTVLVGAQVVLHVMVGGASGADPLTGVHQHSSAPGAWMVAAHLAAALITALVLHRGEEWCHRLVELLSRPLRALRLLVAPVPAGRLAVAAPFPGARPGQWLEHSQPRRGPPAAAAA